MTRSFACCVAILVLSATPAPAQEPAPSRAKELDVLERSVGTWQTETVTKAPDGAEHKSAATVVCEWTLDRQFLQSRGVVDGKQQDLSLVHFDPRTRKYRSYTFLAAGVVIESDGTWDPAHSTMTWTGTDEHVTTTAVERFTGKDAYEWSLTVRDPAGKLLAESKQRATRKR